MSQTGLEVMTYVLYGSILPPGVREYSLYDISIAIAYVLI